MDKVKLNNKIIPITHPNKILFPKSNITKADIINYYIKIGDHILSYIKNRPLTLECFPNGIGKESFYRQHAIENAPQWLKTIELPRKIGGTLKHILFQDKASLAYYANQNMITIHRWLSNINTPEIPDMLIIDIDPPLGRFDLCSKAALLIKKPLEEKGYKPEVMLTGSRGVHIITPNTQKLAYEEARAMLHAISSEVANLYPTELSIDIRKKEREGHAYLDISRNSYGQSSVSPLSVRGKENAPIAMLIKWEDLYDPTLKPDKYLIQMYLT